jgi:WD40 repeat protein
MARHLLIATATSRYKNLEPKDQRPQLPEVLGSVVKLFTDTLRCYQRELEAIAENPPAETFRKKLDEWFGAPERNLSDWVVLYYTGHAEVISSGSDSLYLLTSDFQPFQYVGTAFSLQQLADVVLARQDDRQDRRVRNLLVIVDTCFAGEGTAALTSKLSSVFRKSSGSSFYLLGAALPRQEAQAGALAKALIESIEELSKRYVMQEWLFLEQIVPAINQRLRTHDAVWSAVDSAREEPHFFPNPSFLNTGGTPVAANDARRAISDQEFREHWGPRSRGVEFDSQPGSYFSGRKAVLDILTEFLDGQVDNRTRVITGRPGAGKSAILSRLVSGAYLSSEIHGSSTSASGPVIPVDIALHAKGKNLEEITARFAGILGVEAKTESILEGLRTSKKPFRIIVDALDEAVQPATITSLLLRPMNSIDSVRLVVGTRANQLGLLHGAEIVDIDTPELARKEDVAQYVKLRLLRAGEPGLATPYARKSKLAARVAGMVAEKAYPNFLVARLVAEDLLTRHRSVNLNSLADVVFPASVSGAFDTYLARFGEKETTVRDLLLPLAYAEGQGLPWDNIWASLASALSRRKYNDDDIRWFLENAGTFVLESVEDGHSVYRLYHQALTDALRSGKKPNAVQRIFFEALMASIPRQPGQIGPDWLLANRYIRSYLSTHAARCGRLGDLIRDPAYLLAADASRLLAVLDSHLGEAPGDLVHVYKSAVHHIAKESPGNSASYLEMTARQNGATDFADTLAKVAYPRKWQVPWAHWLRRTTSRLIAKGGEVSALETATLEGKEPVALVGRGDGSVEIWRIDNGERLAMWKPEEVEVEHTQHLGLADTQDGRFLIASWLSGHFGLINLATGKSKILTLTGKSDKHELHAGKVSALCVIKRDDKYICITAQDNLRLAMWELPTLNVLVDRPNATQASIYDLSVVQDHHGSFLLSLGDSVYERQARASMIRLWSLADLSLLWEDPRRERNVLMHADSGRFLGRNLLLASTAGWGDYEIVDLDLRKSVFRSKSTSSRSWIREFQGEPLMLSEWRGKLAVYKLSLAQEGQSKNIVATEIRNGIPVHGERFTGIINLHDRPVVLSSVLDHVRVWDLQELLSEESESVERPVGSTNSVDAIDVLSLATSVSRPNEFYVGTRSGEVMALDSSTGAVQWRSSVFGDEGITTLASGTGNLKKTIAAGHGGVIELLDIESPSAGSRSFKIGESIQRISTVEWQGKSLAFVTVEHGKTWSVRIWDLETRKELRTGREFQLRYGEEDKTLYGLTVREAGGSIHLAFASKYGKVMVAHLNDLDPAAAGVPNFREWHLPHSSGEYVMSLASGQDLDELLLAVGTQHGDLSVLNFMTGTVKWSFKAAHVGHVSALSFHQVGERALLVSGGSDGVLRFWGTHKHQPFDVEVDELINAIAWLGPNELAVGTIRGVLKMQVDDATMKSLFLDRANGLE